MTELLGLTSAATGVFVLLVVLRAALHKAMDFAELQGFIADYRLLPDAWIARTAGALAVTEFLLALLVVPPATRSTGLIGCALLFAGYAAVIGINLSRGHTRIECGCGGAPQILSSSLLARNGVLLICALFAAAIAPGPLSLFDSMIAIGAGGLGLALYILFEQINANRVYLKRRGSL